ncbi:uncharacterized protein LOC134239846 [Saccostrea cucullata]|uniref:uncharacterized protein LOC134239846 n=1 Tax=Saccostrea cuccullata TaxID=36930 RepID=UPI002ED43BF5
MNLRVVGNERRQKHKDFINNVRSNSLYKSSIVLSHLKTASNRCSSELLKHKTIGRRVQVLLENTIIQKCEKGVSSINSLLKQQRKEISKYLASMHNCEKKFEQSAYRPVEFLVYLKKTGVPIMKDIPKFVRFDHYYLDRKCNIKENIQALCEFPIRELGTIQFGSQFLLKLMPIAVLKNSIKLEYISNAYHICCVTSEMITVSDEDKIFLVHTTNQTQHLFTIKNKDDRGVHTVNGVGELIYMDKNFNIKSFSAVELKTKTLVKKIEPWRPRCIYCNPSTGELLVGMKRIQTMSNQSTTKWTGKVNRYNSKGQRVQTIPRMTNKNSQVDYRTPFCITENCNRDIIVSDIDLGAVVVVNHLGQNRFSFKLRSQVRFATFTKGS